MSNLRIGPILVVLSMNAMVGCSNRGSSYSDDGSNGDGSTTGTGMNGGEVCLPGASLYCFDCGQEEGKQFCLLDGSGYGPCVCPDHCDNTEFTCDSCVECAIKDTCSEAWVRCNQNQACVELSNCHDNGNVFDCAKMFPSGADDYVALMQCVFCKACPTNCSPSGWCDTDCVNKCMMKYPYGVSDGWATYQCLACNACPKNCQNICDANLGICSAGTCGECMVGACAASVCANELTACNADCQSFNNCIANTCN